MRRNLLIILIIFVLLLLLTPFLHGYFFKKSFYKKIDAINSVLVMVKIPFKLAVNTYDLGYLDSTAQIVVVPNKSFFHFNLDRVSDFSFKVDVSHGPIVSFNNQFKLGLAALELNLQELINSATKLNVGIKTNILANYSGTWMQNVYIPAQSLPYNFGLLSALPTLPQVTGNFTYHFDDLVTKIKKLNYDIQIEAINIQEISFGYGTQFTLITSPILVIGNLALQQNGVFDRELNLGVERVNFRMGKNGFDLNGLNFYSNFIKNNDNTYNNDKSLQFKSLVIMSEYDSVPVKNLSDFSLQLHMKNLNTPLKSLGVESLFDNFLYTTDSEVEGNFLVNTDLGKITLLGKINWNKESLQKDYQWLMDNKNITIHAEVPYDLLFKLAARSYDIDQKEFENAIAQLLKSGFIIQKSNILTSDVTINKHIILINKKSAQEFLQLIDDLNYPNLTRYFYEIFLFVDARSINKPDSILVEDVFQALNYIPAYNMGRPSISAVAEQLKKYSRYDGNKFNKIFKISDIKANQFTLSLITSLTQKACIMLKNKLPQLSPVIKDKIHLNENCTQIIYGVLEKNIPMNAPGIHIIEATYGKNCNAASGNMNVFVGNECNGKFNCDYTVEVNVLGDPTPNCAKDFRVKFRCNASQVESEGKLSAEADTKTLSLHCDQDKPSASEKNNFLNSNLSGLKSMRFRHSHLCVDVFGGERNPGAKIIQWECHYNNNQRWRFVPVDNDQYHIISESSGLCLDVANASKTAGTLIQQSTCQQDKSQRWEIKPTVAGYQIIFSPTGMCLDINQSSVSQGVQLQLWPCTRNNNQILEIQ